MKPTAILATGLVLLVVVFSIVTFIQITVFFLSGLMLILLCAAIVLHVRGPKLLSIELPPTYDPDAITPTIVIQGKEFKPNRPTVIVGRVTLAGVPFLAGTLLIALAIFYIVLTRSNFTRPIDSDSSLYFALYFLTYFSVIPLYIAGRFFLECQLLANAVVTIGFIQQHLRGALGVREFRFEFRDLAGSYLGDTSRDNWRAGITGDNAVLVFFHPTRPTLNKAAASLLFHRVDVSLD